MDKDDRKIQPLISFRLLVIQLVGKTVLVVKTVLSTLASLLSDFLLEIDSIHQFMNSHGKPRDQTVKKTKVKDLPQDYIENMTLPVKETFTPTNTNSEEKSTPKNTFKNTFTAQNTNSGGKSTLKETFAESVSDWRDIFIQDIYFIGMERNRHLRKPSLSTEFIKSKIAENKKEKPPKQKRPQEVFDYIYKLLKHLKNTSYAEIDKMWDWRSAYYEDNHGRENVDKDMMDRVERDYPNFGDKVRIKKDFRSRKAIDAGKPDFSNYRNEGKYGKPELWEGIVINLRKPGDSIIIVYMLNVYTNSEYTEIDDEGNERNYYVAIGHSKFKMPITFVEGLGPASHKEREFIEPFFEIPADDWDVDLNDLDLLP